MTNFLTTLFEALLFVATLAVFLFIAIALGA
jgi:hypothetical protein